MSAFQDIIDQDEAEGVELSENVAEDFVRYFRGNVVGHEEEGLLMYLGLLSGWTHSKNCHINTIGLGPPGSGKSLSKNTVENLFDNRDTYTKTDASSNAILDSVDWDLSLVAPLDELDKINQSIKEVLKSSNSIDDGYSKDRNVEDSDAKGGYAPVEVSADANPWVVLYAPTGRKDSVDDELADRALILYFSNSKTTRRGIMRKEFGHEDIEIGSEADVEYIYDTHELAAKLRQRVRELPVASQYEEDDGEEQLVSRTGDTPIWIPHWVVYACEPIFNKDEDYTNRVFGILVNLIQCSALLNHDRRAKREIEVYVDEDSMDTYTREAVVVGPQDVANVLSCLPTLLSTTHQLTPLKRHILDAVEATKPLTDGDGTTVQDVRGWLDDNNIPHPQENTLRDRMDELAQDYYLYKWENAAGGKGGGHLYEKQDEGALQPPQVYDLDQAAKRIDGLDLPVDDCVEIDPSDPFADCHDPIRDQPFKETVEQFEVKFSSDTSTETTDAADYMGGDPHDDSEDTSGGGGQSSLTDVSSDGVETPTDDDEMDLDFDSSQSELSQRESVKQTLEPEGKPENPTQQWVFENVETDVTFGPQDGVHNFIGAANPQVGKAKADFEGTVCSPEHDLWHGRPDMADDRVVSEIDALNELEDAYKELIQKDLIAEDESQGPPAMFQLCVAELE